MISSFTVWQHNDARVSRHETLCKKLLAAADQMSKRGASQYPEFLRFVCERANLRSVRQANGYEHLIIAHMSDADGVEMMLKWSDVKTPRGKGRWEHLEANH